MSVLLVKWRASQSKTRSPKIIRPLAALVMLGLSLDYDAPLNQFVENKARKTRNIADVIS
jgi:hypothetical protein